MESRLESRGDLRVDARAYSLLVRPEGPWLEIWWAGGHVRLGAGAGDGGRRWSLSGQLDGDGRVVLSSEDGRRLILECHEEWLYAWAELPEPGEVPSLLAGPGLPLFRRLFSPEPTALRRHLFGPEERAVAAIGSDPAFHEGHWFFSPPPFCFGLEAEGGTLAVGVASAAEELDFSAFEYDGAFRFRYDRAPRGPYRSPRLLLLPTGGDGYQAVEAYAAHLRREGLAPRGTGRQKASWWSEPNFCGWGEQSYRGCALSSFVPGRLPEGSPGRSTQQLYEESLARLEAEGIDPGVVTIDDQWQRVYGLARPDETRWPDLAGFIARQHARGRRVLLWWKLWDGEGLPPEELLTGGSRPVVDPTSPAYGARLAREVRHALLELGADGFKVDFLHRGPTPEHGPARGGISGVRLLRAMLEVLRDPALEAKEDCLLVAHAANPYLADLADVVRLNDISCPQGVEDLSSEMRHRARLARAACPEALIDADNWPCPDRWLWAEYVAAQPEIGIPSLYYATGIDLSGEALQPEDYATVRQAWGRWRQRTRSRQLDGGFE